MGKKVDQLSALASGSVVGASDLIPIFDDSANKLKKISVDDLATAMGSGGLTKFTESDGGSGGTEYCALTATDDPTNVDAVIAPKGDGGFRLSTGGNARGTYAVDLQIVRGTAQQVASGAYSGITNGFNNIANGAQSRAGGRLAYATNIGEDAYASGSVSSNPGGSQRSTILLSKTNTGTGAFVLHTDPSTSGLPAFAAANDGAWYVNVNVLVSVRTVGNGTVATNDSYAASFKALFKMDSSTFSMIDSQKITESEMSSASMSDVSVAITADAGNDAVQVEVTPGANAGSTTVLWAIAQLDIIQLANS